jgi:hypothetical protein
VSAAYTERCRAHYVFEKDPKRIGQTPDIDTDSLRIDRRNQKRMAPDS